MVPVKLTKSDHARIEKLLAADNRHTPQITLFRDQLLAALSSAENLNRHIHSMRSRLKDPEHLRDKLGRKILACRAADAAFDITPENLLLRVTDLAGIRILHLYTRQIRDIDGALREILSEAQYDLIEGPFARTWDDESREYFRQCGIETQDSPSLYTSVHYVIGSASRTRVTAEIQVRTLSEELWGEVDHTLNYPYRTNSVACSEQLKVLARVTSSATRLVDSIFLTMEEHRRASAAAGPTNRSLATSLGTRSSTPMNRPPPRGPAERSSVRPRAQTQVRRRK
jgi:ppGpp synthetase/RelA/SpoT-type nucleotidyltranferase